MVRRGIPLAVYAATHFLVDFSCALLLLGGGEKDMLFLSYNFCAFALQMPLGIVADRLGRCRAVAAAGCLLAAAAWAFGGLAGALCAGVGNALFHVGGGLDTLEHSGARAGPLGIFVAPGALGIFAGGALAGRVPGLWAAAALLLAGGGILVLCWAEKSSAAPEKTALSKTGAGALVCLLAVVIFRGWLGFQFSFPWRGELGAALVCAVALGKAAGGLLADRLGLLPTAAISLCACAGLFLFSDFPAAGLAAVFLFNLTMPLTLWAAARLLPFGKGFAFGLLTFGLFLGFLPTWLGLSPPLSGGGLYALSAACSLPPLLYGLKKAVGRC